MQVAFYNILQLAWWLALATTTFFLVLYNHSHNCSTSPMARNSYKACEWLPSWKICLCSSCFPWICCVCVSCIGGMVWLVVLCWDLQLWLVYGFLLVVIWANFCIGVVWFLGCWCMQFVCWVGSLECVWNVYGSMGMGVCGLCGECIWGVWQDFQWVFCMVGLVLVVLSGVDVLCDRVGL